jgi:hypothetical protein
MNKDQVKGKAKEVAAKFRKRPASWSAARTASQRPEQAGRRQNPEGLAMPRKPSRISPRAIATKLIAIKKPLLPAAFLFTQASGFS